MVEELLVTARHNYKVDPGLAIWSWEIPVYLFLGGLTAGIVNPINPLLDADQIAAKFHQDVQKCGRIAACFIGG